MQQDNAHHQLVEIIGSAVYVTGFVSLIFLLITGRWVNVLIGVATILLSSTICTIVLLPGHLIHKGVASNVASSKGKDVRVIFILGWVVNICLMFGSALIIFLLASSPIKPGFYVPSYLWGMSIAAFRWLYIADFEKKSSGFANKATDLSVLALVLGLVSLVITIPLRVGFVGIVLFAVIAIATIAWEFKIGIQAFNKIMQPRKQLSAMAQNPKNELDFIEPIQNNSDLQAEQDFKQVTANTKKLESLYRQGLRGNSKLSHAQIAKFKGNIYQIAAKYDDNTIFDQYWYALFEQQAIISFIEGDKEDFNKFHQEALDTKPAGAQFASERAKDWGGDHIVEMVQKAKNSRLQKYLNR